MGQDEVRRPQDCRYDRSRSAAGGESGVCYLDRGTSNLEKQKDCSLRYALPMPKSLKISTLAVSAVLLLTMFLGANARRVRAAGQPQDGAYRQMQAVEYRASVINCFKQDDEIMPQVPFRQGQGFMFPLGGQFLQSHDVTSILPRGY